MTRIDYEVAKVKLNDAEKIINEIKKYEQIMFDVTPNRIKSIRIQLDLKNVDEWKYITDQDIIKEFDLENIITSTCQRKINELSKKLDDIKLDGSNISEEEEDSEFSDSEDEKTEEVE